MILFCYFILWSVRLCKKVANDKKSVCYITVRLYVEVACCMDCIWYKFVIVEVTRTIFFITATARCYSGSMFLDVYFLLIVWSLKYVLLNFYLVRGAYFYLTAGLFSFSVLLCIIYFFFYSKLLMLSMLIGKLWIADTIRQHLLFLTCE